MSLSAKIREQLISSFRADLTEHVQIMTDGLLALEQGSVAGEQRRATLENIFRAAHSLKGAARAVGVTAVERIAHALESVLDAIQRDAAALTPELFSTCFRALDALQAVQAAYEPSDSTPPAQALQALVDLESFLSTTTSGQDPAIDSGQDPAIDSGQDPAIDSGQDPAIDSGQDPAIDSGQAPLRQQAQETQDGHVPSKGSGGDSPTLASAMRAGETIRVSADKLDALMAQLSELLVTKIRAEQRLAQIRQYQGFVAQWHREWRVVRGVYGRLARKKKDAGGTQGALSPSRWPEVSTQDAVETSLGSELLPVDTAQGVLAGNNGQGKLAKDISRLLDYVGTSQERLYEMQAMMDDLSRQYASDTMYLSLVVDELEQEIKRVRMLPLSTITGSFRRMVRDLAQEAGKEAVLKIVGSDTELDKRVLERISDPLIHLLRNAVDHGIESPQERVALGKPRKGTITLTAEQAGQDVILCISDDGAGLDLDAIRRAVARKVGDDAQSLTEAQVVAAIFNLGVSTSPIITDISGRGVGLDIVRRNVEALHGQVEVDWTPGTGTTFTLILPAALTSSRGLLVCAANQLFAIPLNAVERIIAVGPADISPLEGRDTVRHNGRPVSLVRISDVLQLPSVDVPHEDACLPAVILKTAERSVAFVVDDLAGEQEVVVRGLGRQLLRVGGIAGATLMGSGEVVLILNVADLIKLAVRERRSVFDAPSEAASATKARAQKRILIVDDSITTRTLEKSILQAAGYVVQVATDGQEALGAIATDGVPDLIISDIVMPRMNGFELAHRIKNDAHTADVPVILVTSLDSAADKARGIQVGADAYIVKSDFDQTNLLETIEQLI